MTPEEEKELCEWFNFKPSSFGYELSMGRFSKPEITEWINSLLKKRDEDIKNYQIALKKVLENRPAITSFMWMCSSCRKDITNQIKGDVA